MVGLMGGYAVSLHGNIDSISEAISGEYSLPEAYALLPLPQQA